MKPFLGATKSPSSCAKNRSLSSSTRRSCALIDSKWSPFHRPTSQGTGTESSSWGLLAGPARRAKSSCSLLTSFKRCRLMLPRIPMYSSWMLKVPDPSRSMARKSFSTTFMFTTIPSPRNPFRNSARFTSPSPVSSITLNKRRALRMANMPCRSNSRFFRYRIAFSVSSFNPDTIPATAMTALAPFLNLAFSPAAGALGAPSLPTCSPLLAEARRVSPWALFARLL
mmetsp:Transcript_3553/g.6572  ORF Transcript_3553/g.6572 Transcript_3553/m.6572 type:complete len:226 (-) Transcript_3553:804-1481(-)